VWRQDLSSERGGSVGSFNHALVLRDYNVGQVLRAHFCVTSLTDAQHVKSQLPGSCSAQPRVQRLPSEETNLSPRLPDSASFFRSLTSYV
jgi:hypothetical protein